MEDSKRESIHVLAHHGILGMKWGVRRYQNKDGSLTSAGKKRYLNSDGSMKPNKVINTNDYYINQQLSKAKRQTGKKYDLTDKQKKYMDESGNLTLEGGRITLPRGIDLTNYPSLSKERSEYSSAWKKYSLDKSEESYKFFKEKENDLLTKINEENMERGRKWILQNIDPINYYDKKMNEFMNGYKPKSSKNSLFDIDDPELIELIMLEHDKNTMKEYGISEEDYKRFKKIMWNE